MKNENRHLIVGLLLTAAMCCGIAGTLLAQPYVQWTYGAEAYDAARGGIIQTRDGGYISVGESNSFGNGRYDVYVVKTDCCGKQLWAAVYDVNGMGGDDFGRKIREVPEDGYVIVGSTTSGKECCPEEKSDILVMRIKDDGSVIWARTFGGHGDDQGTNIEVLGENFYVTGFTSSFGAGSYDAYMFSLNAGGAVLWANVYGGRDFDSFNALTFSEDRQSIIAVGRTFSFGGREQLYAVRTDLAGDMTWAYYYGKDFNEAANDIVPLSKEVFGFESYAIVGYSGAVQGLKYPYLLKIDGDGRCICDRVYYDPDIKANGEFREVIVDYERKEDVIAVGELDASPSGYGGTDVLLAQINPDCKLSWARLYGGEGYDGGWSVDSVTAESCGNNGYVIAGVTTSFGFGKEDLYLVGTDLGGRSCSTREPGMQEFSPEFCYNGAKVVQARAVIDCNVRMEPRFVESYRDVC